MNISMKIKWQSDNKRWTIREADQGALAVINEGTQEVYIATLIEQVGECIVKWNETGIPPKYVHEKVIELFDEMSGASEWEAPGEEESESLPEAGGHEVIYKEKPWNVTAMDGKTVVITRVIHDDVSIWIVNKGANGKLECSDARMNDNVPGRVVRAVKDHFAKGLKPRIAPDISFYCIGDGCPSDYSEIWLYRMDDSVSEVRFNTLVEFYNTSGTTLHDIANQICEHHGFFCVDDATVAHVNLYQWRR